MKLKTCKWGGEGDSFHTDELWLTDAMKWMWVALLLETYLRRNYFWMGSRKSAGAMLLAMDTQLSTSSSEKQPLVLSEDRWAWIPSEHWLSLIGPKDWEPERMNGFCWKVGYKERGCACVCTCACQLLGKKNVESGQKYSAITASTSRPVNRSTEEHDARSNFNTSCYFRHYFLFFKFDLFRWTAIWSLLIVGH